MDYIKDIVAFSTDLRDPQRAKKIKASYDRLKNIDLLDDLMLNKGNYEDRVVYKALFNADVTAVVKISASLVGADIDNYELPAEIVSHIQLPSEMTNKILLDASAYEACLGVCTEYLVRYNSVLAICPDYDIFMGYNKYDNKIEPGAGFIGIVKKMRDRLLNFDKNIEAYKQAESASATETVSEEDDIEKEYEELLREQEEEEEEEEGGLKEESETTEEPSEQEVVQEEPEEKVDPSYEAKRKDILEKFDNINRYVDSYVAALNTMYSSCYDVTRPAGILTEQGVYYCLSDGSSKIKSSMSFVGLFQAIVDVLPSCGFNKFIKKDGKPLRKLEFEQLEMYSTPTCLYDIHTQLAFGYMNYCPGLRSYTSKLKGGYNTSRVTSWSVMRNWIKEQIREAYIQGYIKCTDGKELDFKQNLEVERHVNRVIQTHLKNVIIVYENNPDINIGIRICSDMLGEGDRALADKVKLGLSSALNTGAGNTVKIRELSYSNGVLDLQIVYNEDKYSKTILFAHQVLPTILEGGIKPSWKQVIMGKNAKTNTTFTENFVDDKNTVIQMYAGSRSGKGVMTMNIVASALAAGCKLMYMDGKPDSSKVLAEMAWSAGRECCVFNGRDAGDSLEAIPGCPERRVDNKFRGCDNFPEILMRGSTDKLREKEAALESYGDEANIPDESREKQQVDSISAEALRNWKMTLYRIMQYYRGLDLFVKLANKRKAMGVTNDKSDYMVGIFDEIQNIDTQVTALFNVIKENAEKFQKELKDKKCEDAEAKAEAVAWYNNFKNWETNIVSAWDEAKTITFGMANVTALFIWQTSSFPSATATSAVAQICRKFETSPKIIGRAAINSGGLTSFGNTTISNSLAKTWYDERFTGANGGFFAKTNGALSKECSATVFRPYNIYGDISNSLGRIIADAESSGLPIESLEGSSLQKDANGNWEVIPEVGFKAYVTKLLNGLGLDPVTQIELAYTYMNDFVLEKSNNKIDLIDFMYSDIFGVDQLSVGDNDTKVEGRTEDNSSNGISKGIITSNPVSLSEEQVGEQRASQGGEHGNGINPAIPSSGASIRETISNVEPAAQPAKTVGLFGDEPKRDSLDSLRDGEALRNPDGSRADKDSLGFGGYDGLNGSSSLPKSAAQLAENAQRDLERERMEQTQLLQNKMQDLLKNLEQASQNTETDRDIELYRKVGEQQLELTKLVSDLVRVSLIENQPTSSYSAKYNGQIVYSSNEDSAPMSFKNSIKTTFDIGKSNIAQKIASMRGIDAQSQEMFKELLSSLKASGFNIRMAGSLYIYEGLFAINNREVPINNYINYNANMYRLIDIVDFNLIAKEFRGLQILVLDRDAFMKMYSQFNKRKRNGDIGYHGAITMLFDTMKSLVEIRYVDYKNVERTITRADLTSAETERQMQSLQAEDEVTSRIAMAGLKRRPKAQIFGKATQARTKVQADFLKMTGKAKAVAPVARKVGTTGAITYTLGAICFPLGLTYGAFQAAKAVYRLGKNAGKAV